MYLLRLCSFTAALAAATVVAVACGGDSGGTSGATDPQRQLCAQICARPLAVCGVAAAPTCTDDCYSGFALVAPSCRSYQDALLNCLLTAPVVCETGGPVIPSCDAVQAASEACAPAVSDGGGAVVQDGGAVARDGGASLGDGGAR